MRDDDQPTTERTSHREFNDAMSAEFVCERCTEPRGSNKRFCSRACYDEARADEDWGPSPKPMTFDQMVAEMDGVFQRLHEIDGEPS